MKITCCEKQKKKERITRSTMSGNVTTRMSRMSRISMISMSRSIFHLTLSCNIGCRDQGRIQNKPKLIVSSLRKVNSKRFSLMNAKVLLQNKKLIYDCNARLTKTVKNHNSHVNVDVNVAPPHRKPSTKTDWSRSWNELILGMIRA